MMNQRNLLLMVITLALVGCATTHKVYHIDHPKSDEVRGVHYTLPRAVVTLDVPIKKTVFKPGRFARFAEETLGIKAKTKGSESHSLSGLPTIGQRTEPDPEEIYVVQVKGGPFQNRELELDLTEQGILTRAKAVTTATGLDFAISTLGTAAGIAGRVISPGGAATQDAASLSKAVTDAQAARELLTALVPQRRILVPKDNLAKALEMLESALGNTKQIQDLKTEFANPGQGTLESCCSPEPSDKGCKLAVSGKLVKADLVRQIHQLAARPQAENVRDKAKGHLEGFDKVVYAFEKKQQELEEFQGLVVVLKGLRYFEKQAATNGSEDSNTNGDAEGAEGTENTNTLETVEFDYGKETFLVICPEETQKIFDHLEKVLALELANEYRALERERKALIRNAGNSPVSAIEVGIREIDARKGKILPQFTGTTKNVIWTAKFEWLPPKLDPRCAGQHPVELFSIANSGILLGPDSSCGELTLINPATAQLGSFLVKGLDDKVRRDTVSLTLACDSAEQTSGKVQAKLGKSRVSQGPEGIFYRIPAHATVTVQRQDTTPPGPVVASPKKSDETKAPEEPLKTPPNAAAAPIHTLVAKAVVVPQFGVVHALPQRAGRVKKTTMTASLYGMSGALEKVIVTSSGAEADDLSGIGTAFATLQDARLRADAAEEAEAAEKAGETAAELTRQKQLLELERDILQLRKELEELENPIPTTAVSNGG